jgi:heme exporter protein D
VNDPAHSIVVRFDLTVYEEEQIDPESIDTDGDGIYDAWEIQYKLNPFRPDSFIDSDHDTFTNFQEFQNGTDPTKRISHPPYPPMEVESDDDDGTSDEQYMSVTIAIVLLSIVIIIILVLLAFSKRRTFLQEVEEEKELEAEEMDYRQTLERKKMERMNLK